MRIALNIPADVVSKVIGGIMDNFPEASHGCALRCVDWRYEKRQFKFQDTETGKNYTVNGDDLEKAFRLMLTDKWPKGCTPIILSEKYEDWDNWLCRSDAIDFDAFAQLACLGEVIYG